jgi:hypothetical protein
MALVILRDILGCSLALVSTGMYVVLAIIVFIRLFRDLFSLSLPQELKILLGECGHLWGHLGNSSLRSYYMFLVQRHSPRWRVLPSGFRASCAHHYGVYIYCETVIKSFPQTVPNY